MTRSNIIDIEGWQYHATDKAILFWTDETSREMAVWLPLSKIETSDAHLSGTSGAITVTLPEWLALEKGLI